MRLSNPPKQIVNANIPRIRTNIILESLAMLSARGYMGRHSISLRGGDCLSQQFIELDGVYVELINHPAQASRWSNEKTVYYNSLAKNKRAWEKRARQVSTSLSRHPAASTIHHNDVIPQSEPRVVRTFTPTANRVSTRIATNGIRFELGQWNKQTIADDSGQ